MYLKRSCECLVLANLMNASATQHTTFAYAGTNLIDWLVHELNSAIDICALKVETLSPKEDSHNGPTNDSNPRELVLTPNTDYKDDAGDNMMLTCFVSACWLLFHSVRAYFQQQTRRQKRLRVCTFL